MLFKFWLRKHTKTKLNELGFFDQNVKFWKPLMLLLPSIVIVILFTVIPLVIAIQKSFTAAVNDYSLAEVEFSFDNFTKLFQTQAFLIGLRNSFLYSLISIPLTICIAILISSAITFVYNKIARGFWQTIFFLPYVTSSVAISISFVYILDSSTGILNNLLGINFMYLDSGILESYNALIGILIYGVWKNLAFNVLIISTAMLGVDKTLYKAAAIDGAPTWKQFLKITLPSIKPTISFLLTMSVLGGLQVFPLALFNNDPLNAINNGGSSMMIFIYQQIKLGRYETAGAATIILFLLGIAYGLVLRNSLNFGVRLKNYITLKKRYVQNLS